MVKPWLEPGILCAVLGVIGGIAGAIVGAAGGAGGDQARRGNLRPWVRTVLYALAYVGAVPIAFGAIAACAGQPADIWGPLLLLGAGVVYVPLRVWRAVCALAAPELGRS